MNGHRGHGSRRANQSSNSASAAAEISAVLMGRRDIHEGIQPSVPLLKENGPGQREHRPEPNSPRPETCRTLSPAGNDLARAGTTKEPPCERNHCRCRSHAASFLRFDRQVELLSLLVILICPMIAGRVLRATRALPRRPRIENFCAHIVDAVPLMKFSPRRRSPKLHSGPSAQRVVPYQNDAHNQQSQKTQQHKG